MTVRTAFTLAGHSSAALVVSLTAVFTAVLYVAISVRYLVFWLRVHRSDPDGVELDESRWADADLLRMIASGTYLS